MALIGLLVFALLLGLLWQRCGVSGCPNVGRLTSYQPGGATVLLDADGEPFANLAPVEHEIVALDSLPDYVPAAFIAIEDKRFYEHHGVDFRRVGGALLADVRAGGFVQGFSTITMQLARNVWPDQLPGRQRTLRRKVLEIRVAADIERKYAKREILELYLNHIYFGGGAYGIEAASRNYFNKPARRLTVSEAAVLAALPKSPTMYNPRRYVERARERRDLVLALMAEQGLIPEAEAAAARNRRLSVSREPGPRRGTEGTAQYFVEATRRILEDRFGEDVYSAPLRVHTTLDRRAQRIAEAQLERQLAAIERSAYGQYEGTRYSASRTLEGAPEYVQGAVVVMDAATGDVRALVGGRDFGQSRFDRATQARRQVGSAFKPFVYAAALNEGYAPSQLVSDSVLRVELPGNEVWEPRNYGGENEGFVTLRDALVRSKNVPTIRLAQDVGLADVSRLARRAGIRSDIPSVPSAAIGTAALTPLELTAAFTPFARLGSAVAPRFVTRVEDERGRTIWEPRVQVRQTVDSAVAYLVTHMLQEAVRRGTATAVRQAGYRGVAAGKTGTTNDGSDAWFAGYTPDLVATVWIGFDRPARISANATGGSLAAPVWGRFMRDYARTGAGEWPLPSRVVELPVDPATGLVLREGCRPERGTARTELFVKGEEPARVCPAGEPVDAERGRLARLGDWAGRQWRIFGRWVTRHFGSEEPQPTPREGDYLGAPRLPRAVEIVEPQVDPREFRTPPVPLGIPVPADTLLPDTVAGDTARRDRIRPDTVRRDTIRRDTIRRDTIRRDTIRRDTVRRDTIRRDTIRPDTTRPDTTRPDTTPS
jgi:penicillin-binding protein 1A